MVSSGNNRGKVESRSSAFEYQYTRYKYIREDDFTMKLLRKRMWTLPALMAIVMVLALACSDEPTEVVKTVEVEKIVKVEKEVEVVKEVMVEVPVEVEKIVEVEKS